MSYNSKYKGAEVEELLDAIKDKVDKVIGKQLSSEDFTTALKTKLEGLNNYNDTEIQANIQSLQTKLEAKGTYSKPINGIPKSDLDSSVQLSLNKADTALQSHQSLKGYATEQFVLTAIEQAITTTLNTEV